MLLFCDSQHKIYDIFEELPVAKTVLGVVALSAALLQNNMRIPEDSGRVKDRALA